MINVKALGPILQASKAAPGHAIRGRLAGAFSQGVNASKTGKGISPLTLADTVVSPEQSARAAKRVEDYHKTVDSMKADGMSDAYIQEGMGSLPSPATAKHSIGDLGENMLARLVNTLSGPSAQANATGSAIGIALGQNPLTAIGSNVAGNVVGRLAGGYARSRLGENSLRAGAIETLANLGVSLKSSEFLDSLLPGSPPPTATELESGDRMLRAQSHSQSYRPAQGNDRQVAELARTAGAYGVPASADSLAVSSRPYSDPRVAGMVQAEIPQLDAATADKLRKRAIENAQSNQFLAGQLSGYMEGM